MATLELRGRAWSILWVNTGGQSPEEELETQDLGSCGTAGHQDDSPGPGRWSEGGCFRGAKTGLLGTWVPGLTGARTQLDSARGHSCAVWG